MKTHCCDPPHIEYPNVNKKNGIFFLKIFSSPLKPLDSPFSFSGISDVNHEMDCRTAWLRSTLVHLVIVPRNTVVFQIKLVLLYTFCKLPKYPLPIQNITLWGVFFNHFFNPFFNLFSFPHIFFWWSFFVSLRDIPFTPLFTLKNVIFAFKTAVPLHWGGVGVYCGAWNGGWVVKQRVGETTAA